MKVLLNLTNDTLEYRDTKVFIQGTDARNKIIVYADEDITFTNLTIAYQLQNGRTTIAMSNSGVVESSSDDYIEGYTGYIFNVPLSVTALTGNIMATVVANISGAKHKFNILNTVIDSVFFEAYETALEEAESEFASDIEAMQSAIVQLQQEQSLGVLHPSDIVDNDESDDPTKILSARMGKVLAERIGAVTSGIASATYNTETGILTLTYDTGNTYSMKVGLSSEDVENMANDILADVNDDFDNYKAEVNQSLDNMTETIEGLGQLQPDGTDTSTNILAFTENKGIYVGTDTGYWYYWNGSQYVEGGVYQTAVNYDGIQEDVFSLTELQLENYYNIYDTFTPYTISTGYRLNTNKYASSDPNYKVIKFTNFKNDEIFLKCKGYQWQAVEEMVVSQARPTNVIGETIVKDVYGVVKRPSTASWLLIMVDVDAVAGDYLVNPITIKQNNHIISRPYFYMVNYTRTSTTGEISTANSKRLTTSGTYFLKKGTIVTTTNEKLIAVYDFGSNDTFQSEKYWYNTVYVIPNDGYYAFTIRNISDTDISYSPEILKIYSDSYNLIDKYNWQDLINSSFLTYGVFDEVNSGIIAKKDLTGNHKLRVLNDKLLHFNKDNVISTRKTDYSFYIYKVNKDATLEVLCSYSKTYRFLEECDVIITFKNDNNTSIDLDTLYSNINFYDYYYDSLCIMSYNVQWFSGRNANTIMQDCIIDKYKPDIIGLQEFRRYTPGSSNVSDTSGMPVWDTIFKEYSYKHTTVVGNANYKGLASKIKFDKVYDVAFTHQNIEQRGYSKTYLKINNKNICWINTHLDLDETTKIAQAKEIYDLVENEEYFIITGDFNTDYCFSVDDEEYITIMKQFIDAGYNSANCSEQHGFLGTYCGAPTIDDYNNGIMRPDDHIITSANITINKVFVDTTKTMNIFVDTNNIDHLPIVAFVTID